MDIWVKIRSIKQSQYIQAELIKHQKMGDEFLKERIKIGRQKIKPIQAVRIKLKEERGPLVPLRLELESVRLREVILWNMHQDEGLLEAQVLRICMEYGLGSSQELIQTAMTLAKQQLAEYKEFQAKWLQAKEALPKKLPNLLIKLDLLFGKERIQIIDQFEWGLGNEDERDIDKFATKYQQELNLPTEAVLAVSFSIREQVYLARRALLAAGLDPSNDEALNVMLVPSTAYGERISDKKDIFTPLVESLNDVNFDRAEQSHERAVRRRKRSQLHASKRRRGDSWAIMSSPPRVYCSVIGSNLSNKADTSIEESSGSESPRKRRSFKRIKNVK